MIVIPFIFTRAPLAAAMENVAEVGTPVTSNSLTKVCVSSASGCCTSASPQIQDASVKSAQNSWMKVSTALSFFSRTKSVVLLTMTQLGPSGPTGEVGGGAILMNIASGS